MIGEGRESVNSESFSWGVGEGSDSFHSLLGSGGTILDSLTPHCFCLLVCKLVNVVCMSNLVRDFLSANILLTSGTDREVR